MLKRDLLEESGDPDEVSFQNSFYNSIPAKTKTKEINFSALTLPPLNPNIFYMTDKIFTCDRIEEQDTPSYYHPDSSPKTKRTKAMEEVITLIQSEKEHITKFEDHINKQKKLVNVIFKEMLERLQSCLTNHQTRLINDLDTSLQNFKRNFEELAKKYENFTQTEPNALQNRIQLQNTQDLYNILSRVYEDENILATNTHQIANLEFMMKAKNRISTALEKLPLVKGLESMTSYEINRAITSTIESSLRKELSFENFVELVTEDEIVTTSRTGGPLPREYIETLKKAHKPLNSEKLEISFKYDASSNDFQPKEIARNLKYYDQALLLIRTACDRLFGFYTDKQKSFAIDFDEGQAKFHSSFSEYMKNVELKKLLILDLANCIKLKVDCDKHKNNIASFGENLISFKVKELVIYEVTGTQEQNAPRSTRNSGESTLKLEKKFGLIHSLIKQKMNL